jgi:hypothetical protein
MRKTYPPPTQRKLMLKLCRRPQGVTVQQAKEQGVNNPVLQIYELRKKGIDIADVRQRGVCKKSVYIVD